MYHPVLKVFKSAFKKTIFTVYLLCFLTENSYFQCLVGDHIWTKPVIKSILVCVCVCVRDTQASRTTRSVFIFREQVFALGTVFQRPILFQRSREEEREI